MNDLTKACIPEEPKKSTQVMMGRGSKKQKKPKKQKNLCGPWRGGHNLDSGVHQASEPPIPQRKWVAPYREMAWGCPVPPESGWVGLIQGQSQEAVSSRPFLRMKVDQGFDIHLFDSWEYFSDGFELRRGRQRDRYVLLPTDTVLSPPSPQGLNPHVPLQPLF